MLYWNARSINQRKEELIPTLKNIDIFVCIETWLKPNQRISFPGFNCYRKDRQHANGGGIAIFIRKNLAYSEIKTITSPDETVEICGLKLTNTVPSFNLIACYRTPGFSLSQSCRDGILGNASPSNALNVFVGDFNAHNIAWNCSHNDSNGDRFLESIDKFDLFLRHTNTLSRVDLYRNKKSNIDLIISSSPVC